MEKKSQAPTSKLVQSGVRMPEAALREYEAWANELNAAAGWNRVTRSDVMRDLLLKALEDRRAAKAAPEKKR